MTHTQPNQPNTKQAEQDTPGFGPLSDIFKSRGWVGGDGLVAFCAQIKLQRENDGSKRGRK